MSSLLENAGNSGLMSKLMTNTMMMPSFKKVKKVEEVKEAPK